MFFFVTTWTDLQYLVEGGWRAWVGLGCSKVVYMTFENIQTDTEIKKHLNYAAGKQHKIYSCLSFSKKPE